jgi:DNA primase
MLKHLKSRGMNPYLYNLSYDDTLVTFPLYDFSGKQVGYQNYTPHAQKQHKNPREARYFTYLPKNINGYFGTESLDFSEVVYLVEGVFKASKLHRLGFSAVALMGSETKRHISQLMLLRRPCVGIGDNDAAGIKFAKELKGFVSPKDRDEMPDFEVLRLLK